MAAGQDIQRRVLSYQRCQRVQAPGETSKLFGEAYWVISCVASRNLPASVRRKIPTGPHNFLLATMHDDSMISPDHSTVGV